MKSTENQDRYREAVHVCRQLTAAGWPTVLAGGCVRDRLLERVPGDYDLAGTARPQEIMAFFKQRGMTVLPIGIDHGTVTLVTQLQNLEITTLRSDNLCDGRRARVTFSKSFEEDAHRRDLTINALFEDADGNIIDYVGGLDDLANRRLRFVGQATGRIKEDYLRMLRYMRFAALLGWQPMADQVAAIAENVQGLKILSAERIQGECRRILTGPYVGEIFPHFFQSGLLPTLFPWFQEASIPRVGSLLAKLKEQPPVLAWFSLFQWGTPGGLSSNQIKQESDFLKLRRKERTGLLQLRLGFSQLNEVLPTLQAFLKICETGFLNAGQLSRYLKHCRQVLRLDIPPVLLTFLKGVSVRSKPPSAPADLETIPPRKRGEAVMLLKICWYLGLAYPQNQLAGFLKKKSLIKKALASNRLERIH